MYTSFLAYNTGTGYSWRGWGGKGKGKKGDLRPKKCRYFYDLQGDQFVCQSTVFKGPSLRPSSQGGRAKPRARVTLARGLP